MKPPILVVTYHQYENLVDWAGGKGISGEQTLRVNAVVGKVTLFTIHGQAVLPVIPNQWEKWKPIGPFIDLRCVAVADCGVGHSLMPCISQRFASEDKAGGPLPFLRWISGTHL